MGELVEPAALIAPAMESASLAHGKAIARLQLRHNVTDDRTREYLKELAVQAESAAWRLWAQLIRSAL